MSMAQSNKLVLTDNNRIIHFCLGCINLGIPFYSQLNVNHPPNFVSSKPILAGQITDGHTKMIFKILPWLGEDCW